MSIEENTGRWLELSSDHDMTQWPSRLSVRALRGTETGEQALTVVVVQLLTIALKVMNWPHPQGQTAMLSVPRDYRTWSMMESELESHGSRRRMHFYVCAKAALLVDGRSFPVGTTFVVDHHRMESQRESADDSLVSRFVLGKYASVVAGTSDGVESEAWRFATYGPEGEPMLSGCRVLRCTPPASRGRQTVRDRR